MLAGAAFACCTLAFSRARRRSRSSLRKPGSRSTSANRSRLSPSCAFNVLRFSALDSVLPLAPRLTARSALRSSNAIFVRLTVPSWSSAMHIDAVPSLPRASSTPPTSHCSVSDTVGSTWSSTKYESSPSGETVNLWIFGRTSFGSAPGFGRSLRNCSSGNDGSDVAFVGLVAGALAFAALGTAAVVAAGLVSGDIAADAGLAIGGAATATARRAWRIAFMVRPSGA